MASKKFGFAVLGQGSMGGVHIQNLLLSARASLRWLMRSKQQEAERFVAAHGLQTRCAAPSDLNHILDDSSVDAVLICSPTDVHEDQIRRSLQAGKAVFCEKPITSQLACTAACYDLAESQKKPLFHAFHRRFDPSIREVRAGVQSGQLGALKMLRISSHDPSYPPISYIKSSGGIVMDSTIHDLDLGFWLSGSSPKRVYCQGQAFNPEIKTCGDFDLVVVTVLFGNGVVVVIDNGRKSSQAYDQRLEAICENGGYLVSNRPSSLASSSQQNQTLLAPIESHYIKRYTDAYRTELEHFLDVLEGIIIDSKQNMVEADVGHSSG